jgi:hypothetical protein
VVTTAAVTATTTTAVVAALDSGLVFGVWLVVGVANVSLAIAGFIGLEVVKGFCTMIRERSVVAVTWIVAIVDVAIVAVMTVIPGTSSDEHAADEPVGSIVAIRSARVRGVVEVSIWADWGYSNADGDLGGCKRSGAQQRKCDGGKSKRLYVGHWSS